MSSSLSLLSSLSAVRSPMSVRGGATAALFAAGILWGTSGLAGSVLAEQGMSSVTVAMYRLLIGGVLALSALAVTGGLRTLSPTRATVIRLLAAGGLFACYQAFYFAAVSLTSVTLATMSTIGSVPVFVAVATTVRQRRVPSVRMAVFVGLAVAGLALLVSSRDVSPSAGGGSPALGIGCALLAGALFAVQTIITATPVPGVEPLHTTAFGCLIGGLVLLVPAAVSGLALPQGVSGVLVAGYLGVVPTALAYSLYFRGLVRAPAVLAALSTLLEPLTATLLAVLLLGERLGALGWCGAAVLGGALMVSHLWPEPDREADTVTGARRV